MHSGNPRGDRRVRRRLRTCGAAGAALIAGLGLFTTMTQPASAKGELLEESFGGATVSDVWQMISPKGTHTPCLTAATEDGVLPACDAVKDGSAKPDPEGEGVFQITDNSKQDAGGLVLNQELDARKGLHIEFDTYQYNAGEKINNLGADGISFFLVDGSQDKVEPGAPGGGLAYKGLKGGVIGLGLDQFGNFSNPQWGGKGGPGAKPNNIVVRGAEESGYQFVKGVEAPAPLAVDDATKRADAKRHVIIDLSPDNWLSVSIDAGDGPKPIIEDMNLDDIKGQPKLPKTLKLGFAASTGDATAYHEIGGFSASSLDPNLAVAIDNAGWSGSAGTAQLNVSNAQSAAAATGAVKLTYSVTAGMTIKGAAGEGWECQVAEGKQVTCSRQDGLKAGGEFPPVTLDLAAGGYGGSVTGTAEVALAQGADSDPSDNKATSEFAVEAGTANGPDLSVAAEDVKVPAGGTATVPVTVSNADGSGPTTDEVGVAYAAGSGVQIVSAKGEGWTCEVKGQIAACTRPGKGDDALAGGSAYPAVNIELKAPDDASGVVGTASGVATVGDTDTANNIITGNVTVEPPADGKGKVIVDVTSAPNPYVPGKPFTYKVVVTNTDPLAVAEGGFTANWPTMWESVKWTCEGPGCPAAEGKGDISGKLTLPPGQTVFTVTCLMPESAAEQFVAKAAFGETTAEDVNPVPDYKRAPGR